MQASIGAALQPTGSRDADGKRSFRVGEVARMTGLPAHVLRYWETEFSELCPTKSSGGQRLYTPDDIELIFRLKDLLHGQGFTIAGARRRLQCEREASPPGQETSDDRPDRRRAEALIEELRAEIRTILTLMEVDDTL